VQGLLACLAPFSGVYFTGLNDNYSKALRRQPALAGLPFERWTRVLLEAQDWGLLSPHPEAPGFQRLQPTLPYFLRLHLAAPGQAQVKAAIEAAFRQVYQQVGGSIYKLIQSKDPEERQLGLGLAALEYENLSQAVELSLAAQTSILEPYRALSDYLDAAHQHPRGLALGERILQALESYLAENLSGTIGAEFVMVIDDIARWQMETNQFLAAEVSYQKALALVAQMESLDENQKGQMTASLHHQLGRVAQEQRQWAQAEAHYQQALAIYIEYNDRNNRAKTYHQLGRVAQEQRQWAQAEAHYQQALRICIEFGDRYYQATTYHNLGVVAEKQRQWAQAEANYQQALKIYDEFGDRYSQASTYHQLGMVAQEQRQWAQAEAHYQQALRIFIDYNDRYGQASTYGQLGLLAEEQGQSHQAQEYMLKCLEIFVEFSDMNSVEKTVANLGRLWRKSGDASLPAAAGRVLGAPPAEVEARWRKMEEEDEEQG
jgi:tetratricopeptide (TPR) repeat protein